MTKEPLRFQQGDFSKPIVVFADYNSNNPFFSSAGIRTNIDGSTTIINLSLDNIGIYKSIKNGNSTNSFGVKLNLSELKLGFEATTTTPTRGGYNQNSYMNVSINGWPIVAIYYLLTTGQYIGSPTHVYA